MICLYFYSSNFILLSRAPGVQIGIKIIFILVFVPRDNSFACLATWQLLRLDHAAAVALSTLLSEQGLHIGGCRLQEHLLTSILYAENMAANNRDASRQAWPCQISVWLPLQVPSPAPLANSNFKQLAAGKTSTAGNWLTSKSKDSELISIETAHGAIILKLSCAGGRHLFSTAQLSPERFNFCLANEVLLLASALGPNGIYTFSCLFICHQHAVECAASLKAAMTPARSMVMGPATIQQAREIPSIQQNRANELLLLRAVASDPEKTGAAWWSDFPQVVQEIERAWNVILVERS